MDSDHGIPQPYTPTSPADDLCNQAAATALEVTILESTVESIHAHYTKLEQNRKHQPKKNRHQKSTAPKIGQAPLRK